ncbi:hypothetical protein [Paracoccus marinaquae]|uniref:Lipopolysaccharide export system protein LptC n=1 Tax=Paracoccus marinaquae TaxID=2841926 RepID=A0ABS6AMZ6_9RHOB|nr:hypothetical protein [Paracoccus marinaquae]MBU3031029.1 hypothetical protein [Paracoccus marinaquae]
MNRTRIVRWLRLLLPLVALTILSTMFLFSRKPEGESRIPYTSLDAEQMAREPRIVAPKYSGVTDDGAEIALIAREAQPARDDSDGSISDLRLDWRRPDGLAADLTAPTAELAEGLITLLGGVNMSTSTGWTLQAPQMNAATDRSRLSARDGVQATAPFGRITSDEMELIPGPETAEGERAGDSAVLNFSGSVRLIYQP